MYLNICCWYWKEDIITCKLIWTHSLHYFSSSTLIHIFYGCLQRAFLFSFIFFVRVLTQVFLLLQGKILRCLGFFVDLIWFGLVWFGFDYGFGVFWWPYYSLCFLLELWTVLQNHRDCFQFWVKNVFKNSKIQNKCICLFSSKQLCMSTSKDYFC